MTSKVKADVQQVGDELIVSGLESATSLIQAAKNLLNAVVLTVKSAYIASTKVRSFHHAREQSMTTWFSFLVSSERIQAIVTGRMENAQARKETVGASRFETTRHHQTCFAKT